MTLLCINTLHSTRVLSGAQFVFSWNTCGDYKQ